MLKECLPVLPRGGARERRERGWTIGSIGGWPTAWPQWCWLCVLSCLVSSSVGLEEEQQRNRGCAEGAAEEGRRRTARTNINSPTKEVKWTRLAAVLCCDADVMRFEGAPMQRRDGCPEGGVTGVWPGQGEVR